MSEVDVAAEPPKHEGDGAASTLPSEIKSDEPAPPSTSGGARHVRTKLAALLALCVAMGVGVGVGYAASRGSSKSCETAAVGATLRDNADPLSMIEAGAGSKCSADSISSQSGLDLCRDFCAPATCCFSPSSQKKWERDGISGTGKALLPGGGRRELGASASRGGSASKVPSAGSNSMSCLSQDICEAFGPCSVLFQDDYATIQYEVRAKCQTSSLFTPEGVGVCLDLCTPALDAGCFANEVGDEDDEDGELEQEGKASYAWLGRHSGLSASSRGPLCDAYAACRILMYLEGGGGGLVEDDVAEAVVKKACDGMSRQSCLDVCDPAECCFVLGDGEEGSPEGRSTFWNDRGRHVLEEPFSGVKEQCAEEGLLGLHCDHYEACSVLLPQQSLP